MAPGGRRGKVRRTSTPPAQERLKALEALFPEAFGEGRLDLERLRQALGEAVDGGPERYAFTWAGKREAIRLLRVPTRAALAPAAEASVGFETARNVLIEGDNLEALKLLYKACAGRVKMIYIDPPYNTGGEFVYPDDYADPLGTYLRLTGQSDQQGNLLTSNPETSGRFHSAWLSMMYPRLFLARQLLRDDGILFVSIDEHERHNLQLLMNEIFGEENLVADLIWKKKSGGGSDAKEIVVDHEYILAYGRSRPAALFADKGATAATRYNQTDEEGRRYSLDRLDKPSLGYQESLDFPIEGPDGRTYRVPHADPRRKVARWRWSRKRVEERRGELVFRWPHVYTRNYEKEGSRPRSLLVDPRFGRTRTGKTDLTALFGAEVLERAKPVRLIRHLCAIATGPGDIVLDFFAGSGTTGQAVMELNREDGGRRRWILVQLPEPTGEESAAKAEGLGTIAEICAERLRRGIARLREEWRPPRRRRRGGPRLPAVPTRGEQLPQRARHGGGRPGGIRERPGAVRRPSRRGLAADGRALRGGAEGGLRPRLPGRLPRRDRGEHGVPRRRRGAGPVLPPLPGRRAEGGDSAVPRARPRRPADLPRRGPHRRDRRQRGHDLPSQDPLTPMKLRFDAHQPFQVRAVEAVADLLQGQPPVEAAVDLGPGDLPAVANRLDLDEPRLLANLRRVQEASGIRPDDGLRFLEEEIEAPGGSRTVRFPNFSVEMETGTGKTYVYLRTMLELHHRCRLRKFIVVVPSVAIREGVLKSLEVTRDHFARLYGNTVLRHAEYDASSRSQVSQFALSGSVEVLVMTIDAFNKAVQRHPAEHRPPPGAGADRVHPGGPAGAGPRRAPEHGEPEEPGGPGLPRPALRPALQRHPPAALQPRLPPDALSTPTARVW